VSDPTAASAAASPRRGVEHRGRRVAANSMTMLSGQVLFTLIGFVTTPVVLSHVGLVEFGLWTLIMTTVAYVTVVDPGFGDLITRYGARAHLAGDRALGARLCTLATLVWLGFGLVGLPIVLWVVPAWVPHLHLHAGLAHVAEEFFYWGYAYTIAGSVSAIMSSRLTAVGDQWLVTAIDAATRLLYAGVLLGMLLTGSKLSALVVASSVQLVVTFLVTTGFVWARAGAPYGNPLRLHGGLVREATRFGGWLQLGGVLELLTYETDGLVIGTFDSVSRVGTYGIAQRAAGMTTYFGFFAQSSMLAAISAAHAAGEGLAAMRRMYRRAVRLVGLLGGAIAGALLGTAPVFLAFWLNRYPGGVGITDAATCLAVAALLVGLPRPAAAATIMAMGRVGLGVRAQFAAFAINLVLTVALVRPLGMLGVMLATVVAKVVATGYLLVRFHRMVDGSSRELLLGWATKLLLAIGAGAAACRLALVFLPDSVVHHRGPALAALVPLLVLYVSVFTLVVRATRFFSAEDLGWFEEILPGPLARVVASRATHRLLGAPA
jgi:O-antigen/teichoic acid export membrane protein